MRPKAPLKVGYAILAVKGLLAILAPRKTITLATGVWRLGLENVGALEPREWYLRATRAAGVGMVAAGLTGLVLTAGDDDAGGSDGDGETGDDDGQAGVGDGPIRVDVD